VDLQTASEAVRPSAYPGSGGASRTVADALVERCRRLPDRPMVGGQEKLRWRYLTGAQCLDRAQALACDLERRGIGPGDRVIVWVPNGWRTPPLLLAIWLRGAIVVPFDREMNRAAARSIVEKVAPRLIITGYGQRPDWSPGEGIEEWWEPGEERPSGQSKVLPRALEGATYAAPVAAIFFTSGTTGSPKGCTISHANLLSQVACAHEMIPIKDGDVFGSILPLSHLFEMTCGFLYPLTQGAVVEYIPSRKGPDIVRVLHERHVTHVVMVPQIAGLMGAAAEERMRKLLGAGRYDMLLKLADRLPMSARRALFWPVLHRLGGRLRMLACGGAALPPEVQRLWDRMGVLTLQGYGASECSPMIASGRADGSTPYGTVGKPLPRTEIKFDAAGQLFCRGPQVMLGYWNDPERTAQVIDADGFYATGDICELDPAGNIRVMGRAQELLVLPSGMNVWPEDVEEQLRRSPLVKDAVILLVPTVTGGATIHAYLLPTGARDHDAISTVVAEANGHLASHQRVATASWWPDEDFPRTSTLKVKRRLIGLPSREPDSPAGANGHASVRVDVTQSADDPVMQAIRSVSGNGMATESQSLAELGLDSLGLTGLAVEIESRTGTAIPDGTLDPAMSGSAVRAAVSRLGVEEGVEPQDAVSVGERSEQTKRFEEARTWLPGLSLYTRWRALRRLSAPVELLHRAGVPRVITLGAEHLAGLDDGAILAGTHRSYPDVPTIKRAIAESAASAHADKLVIAASSVIVGRAGILGKFITVAMGLFPMRQYGGQDESLRRLAEISDAGNTILIFPQGHHTNPADEIRGDPSAGFKTGIGKLALDLELPVLPFGLAGTQEVVAAHPPENFTGLVINGIPVRLNKRQVAIAFGALVVPSPGESASALTARVQDACFALSRAAEAALAGQERGS
jgi:long-chain acyl-CoA synthetase